MRPDILKKFVQASRLLVAGSGDSSAVLGTVVLKPDVINLLKELHRSELIENIVMVDNLSRYIDDLTTEQAGVASVTLLPFRLSRHEIDYFTQRHELVSRFASSVPARSFYLQEDDYYSSAEETKPPFIIHYENVVQLVSILGEIANVTTESVSGKVLHFFSKSHLEVPVIYTEECVDALPGITELCARLRVAETRQQLVPLFKIVVEEALASIPVEERFATLLRRWTAVCQAFDNSFRLYLQQFNWEKLKAEVAKERFELLRRINSTVAEIQSKLVAIPAATALVAANVSTDSRDPKNVAIITGSVVLALFMEVILVNQRTFLAAVMCEVDRVWNRLVCESDAVNILETEWQDLRERGRHQRRLLIMLSVCNWCVPISGLLIPLASVWVT